MKKYLYLAITLAIIFAPLVADAQEPPATGIDKLNPTFNDIYALGDEAMKRIPVFLGGLAFLAILYSGAIYITSFGDPNKMEMAKKNLTWTVTGIIAVMSIYAIMSLIMWVANVAEL